MTFRLGADDRAFKRAMIFSAAVHSVLLALIIINPSLPNPRKNAPVYYINFGGPPGGGSGSGGRGGITVAPPAESTAITPTEVKPQTLRDLTTIQKLQADQPTSTLRFPVDKPKREAKPAAAKKTEISKVDPSAKTAAAKTPPPKASAAAGTAGGTGGAALSIGAGKPGFGEGTGSGLGGLSDQIGNSDFPYTWYSTAVRDKISSNWFESLVDPGVGGTFQVAVYFRIFKDGSISTVDIKETSGIKTLDQSAVRAIMRSANFPPLPDGYNESYLGIILIFEHSK
jgi:TonB family protein